MNDRVETARFCFSTKSVFSPFLNRTGADEYANFIHSIIQLTALCLSEKRV